MAAERLRAELEALGGEGADVRVCEGREDRGVEEGVSGGVGDAGGGLGRDGG